MGSMKEAKKSGIILQVLISNELLKKPNN